MNQNIEQVAKEAQALVDKFADDLESGRVTWETEVTPRLDAMRAFAVHASDYHVMVVEANTKEFGIVHEGTIVAPAQGLVMRLPRDIAALAYKHASRQR